MSGNEYIHCQHATRINGNVECKQPGDYCIHRIMSNGMEDGVELTPLRWRTGPVPEDYKGEIMFLVEPSGLPFWNIGYVSPAQKYVEASNKCKFKREDVVKWLPLSEILERAE